MNFRNLFSQITIGQVEVKNRVVMPAFGLMYVDNNRHCGQRLIDFYEARARGGCGLIIVGGVGIDFIGSGFMMPTLESDEYIPGFQKLAEACHRHGAKLFLQLFHAGRYSHSFIIGGKKAVGPSAVTSRYTKEEPRELAKDEILDIQEKFAAAAERARSAGADGVELISSAGYLMCQFLSPLTNLRTDEYGGSFENRMRFSREVIAKVRKRVGPEFPVTMRMSGNDFMPGSNTNVEAVEVCRALVPAGLDAINVTGGWHETRVPQLPMLVPRGAFSYLAAAIRDKVEVPVFASNRIVEPEQAEQILRDGMADMVCVGRAQIADPEWTNKVKAGRLDEIRPCVGCMQGCMDRLFSGKPVQCLSNAQAGFEAEREIKPAGSRKKVLVIGAGPGGLEAAIVAAKRGHNVTLVEKDEDIGGQLALTAAPPGREEFAALLRYYRVELERQKINLKLKTPATLDMIKDDMPDEIILATGSEPLVPELPGVDRPEVATAWQVLTDEANLGKKVVVVGGGAVGVETAIFIAAKGTISGDTLKFLFLYDAEGMDTLQRLCTRGTHQVTILEMLPKIGRDIGQGSRWVLLSQLRSLGVNTITNATLKEIRAGEVVYVKDDEDHVEPADSVVLAVGAKPVTALAEKLKAAGVEFHSVGDCSSPRKIMDAIHEGFLAAAKI